MYLRSHTRVIKHTLCNLTIMWLGGKEILGLACNNYHFLGLQSRLVVHLGTMHKGSLAPPNIKNIIAQGQGKARFTRAKAICGFCNTRQQLKDHLTLEQINNGHGITPELSDNEQWQRWPMPKQGVRFKHTARFSNKQYQWCSTPNQ
jgi:hypothetical protein